MWFMGRGSGQASVVSTTVKAGRIQTATTAHAGGWLTTRVSTSGGTTSAPNQRAVTNITRCMDLV